MTTNTPRDTRLPSDYSNSNPDRDAALAAVRENPNTWGRLSNHSSPNSAGQIKRRLIRANPDLVFRVQTEEDGSGTIFALYPEAFGDDDQ